MRRPGIEPGSPPWEGGIIAIRPSAPVLIPSINLITLL